MKNKYQNIVKRITKNWLNQSNCYKNLEIIKNWSSTLFNETRTAHFARHEFVGVNIMYLWLVIFNLLNSVGPQYSCLVSACIFTNSFFSVHLFFQESSDAVAYPWICTECIPMDYCIRRFTLFLGRFRCSLNRISSYHSVFSMYWLIWLYSLCFLHSAGYTILLSTFHCCITSFGFLDTFLLRSKQILNWSLHFRFLLKLLITVLTLFDLNSMDKFSLL